MRFRKLKKTVTALLDDENLDHALNTLCTFPVRQTVNPLIQLLNTPNESVRWRAITALGVVVPLLAESNMEAAREVVRRLMWQLNSESGGIGWGSAEAMGEILAKHKKLADEYASILISYIGEGENFIENNHLQRGILWALGRLAHERPEVLAEGVSLLLPFLDSKDNHIRGLAAWTAHALDSDITRLKLEDLSEDAGSLTLYLHHQLVTCQVKDLAKGLNIK